MKKTLLPRASFGVIVEDLLFIIRVTYTVAESVCNQGGHVSTLNLKKIHYLGIYPLRFLMFCKTLILLSLHLCLSDLIGSSHCCSFFPLLFIFLWLFFFTVIFSCYWFTGQDKHFIFNCQPTQLPCFSFFSNHVIPLPHSFHFLHFAFYFFDGMSFCFFCFYNWLNDY